MAGVAALAGQNQISNTRNRNVCFSNRPFGVKRFQTIHHHSVDVAHGLVLLFGIGTKALPVWDSKTRRNNLSGGLAVSRRQNQADMRTHLIHRPARDIFPRLGGIRVFSYRIWLPASLMLLRPLGSTGTQCRQPKCGALSPPTGAPAPRSPSSFRGVWRSSEARIKELVENLLLTHRKLLQSK